MLFTEFLKQFKKGARIMVTGGHNEYNHIKEFLEHSHLYYFEQEYDDLIKLVSDENVCASGAHGGIVCPFLPFDKVIFSHPPLKGKDEHVIFAIGYDLIVQEVIIFTLKYLYINDNIEFRTFHVKFEELGDKKNHTLLDFSYILHAIQQFHDDVQHITEHRGTERNDDAIKLNRVLKSPKNYIYVKFGARKPEGNGGTPSGREFSHRWEVSGHWRKVKIGHDREGNVIAGKTWVSSHVRGPDGKEFIKKTRIVTT